MTKEKRRYELRLFFEDLKDVTKIQKQLKDSGTKFEVLSWKGYSGKVIRKGCL